MVGLEYRTNTIDNPGSEVDQYRESDTAKDDQHRNNDVKRAAIQQHGITQIITIGRKSRIAERRYGMKYRKIDFGSGPLTDSVSRVII